jgi:hypothetical protein
MEGREAASRLANITRDIGRDTLTQFRVCELPPCDDKENIRKEIENFNHHVRMTNKFALKMNRISKIPAVDALEENGLNLTDIGAERVAKDLDEQALPATVANSTFKTYMTLNRRAIGRLIGAGGKNRYELERTYKVQMAAKTPWLILKSSRPDNIKLAKQEIEYQVESAMKEDEERERRYRERSPDEDRERRYRDHSPE